MPVAYDYSADFYDDLIRTALPSARRIVPLVLSLVPAKSVVDVGCGNGAWLKVFQEAGVGKVLGIDGDWIALNQLLIEPSAFQRWSLEAPLPEPEERFDLAVSLEVAEHIAPDTAEQFVRGLCRFAPVVLFSAAIPGQGGPGHVNEQWPSYWIELFQAQGFVPVDAVRWRVWDDPEVTWWYKQNSLLFASDEALERYPTLAAARAAMPAEPPALVHPERFAAALKHANPGFGTWLKMAGRAWRRSREKRGRR